MAEEIREVKGEVVVPYHWSYGRALTAFFHETSENRRFMGARCPGCGSVLVPPVGLCGACFLETEDEWVELSDHGVLETFTLVLLPYPGQPKEPPYVYGLIRLDGADTVFAHLVDGVDFEEMQPGMRVKAAWNPERKGDLYDILYFEPE